MDRPLPCILYVDDHEESRLVTAMILKRNNYGVLLAGSVGEAQRILDKFNGIDLVIADIILPDASGLELCREIKGRHPEIPVLYCSVLTHDEDEIAAMSVGGDGYLRKPFTPEALVDAIERLLPRT